MLVFSLLIHSAEHALLHCVYVISLLFFFYSYLILLKGQPSCYFYFHISLKLCSEIDLWQNICSWKLSLFIYLSQFIYKTFLDPNVYLLIGYDKCINSCFVKVLWNNKIIRLRKRREKRLKGNLNTEKLALQINLEMCCLVTI